MHNKNDHITNHANSLPTLLLRKGITSANCMGVIKDKLGGFKT